MTSKGRMAATGASRSPEYTERVREADVPVRKAAADASAVMSWEQGKRGAAAQMQADANLPAADMSPPSGEYAPAAAPKPSFSSARAMEFSDAAGYVYQIDPSTRVIKIAKAPESNKKAEGAMLTATGKNQKAYAAIWGKYGDKVEKLASRSPLDIEVGDDVEEEQDLIGEAPSDKFVSTRGMDGGPNAEAGRNARASLLNTKFSS